MKHQFASNFIRGVIARAVCDSRDSRIRSVPTVVHDGMEERIEMRTAVDLTAERYAEQRWGKHGVPMILRSAVGAVSASPLSLVGAADDEFFRAVYDASLLGRLDGLREVPFNVRTIAMTTPARGYWVGQSKPIPVSKPVLAGSSLPRKKVGAIIVTTKESLEAANPASEARFEEDMRNALTGTVDEAFLDVANAGTADMPPAVTDGAPSIASSGDPSVDVASLIAVFEGDLSLAVFVTDPTTAAGLALARDMVGNYAFPDAGPRGGSILGMPLLVTRGSPRDGDGGQIALIDGSGIASRMESIEIARSTSAMLEMADDPTGATDTPVGASATPVSLFQTDSIAFRATIHANWERQRAAVAVITGCDYVTLAAS